METYTRNYTELDKDALDTTSQILNALQLWAANESIRLDNGTVFIPYELEIAAKVIYELSR